MLLNFCWYSTLFLTCSHVGAIEAIGRADHKSFPKQLLFFAANADEWGFAGSRRFTDDIASFSCQNPVEANESRSTGLPLCADPVYPNTLFSSILRSSDGSSVTIDSALSLDQIGFAAPEYSYGGSYFYGHALNPSESSVTSVIANAAKTVNGVHYTSVPASGLPPTPLTTFVKRFGDMKNRAAVISGYGYKFRDPRYHTQYDNSSHVSVSDVIR
jgi:hypothetical protein